MQGVYLERKIKSRGNREAGSLVGRKMKLDGGVLIVGLLVFGVKAVNYFRLLVNLTHSWNISWISPA